MKPAYPTIQMRFDFQPDLVLGDEDEAFEISATQIVSTQSSTPGRIVSAHLSDHLQRADLVNVSVTVTDTGGADHWQCFPILDITSDGRGVNTYYSTEPGPIHPVGATWVFSESDSRLNGKPIGATCTTGEGETLIEHAGQGKYFGQLALVRIQMEIASELEVKSSVEFQVDSDWFVASSRQFLEASSHEILSANESGGTTGRQSKEVANLTTAALDAGFRFLVPDGGDSLGETGFTMTSETSRVSSDRGAWLGALFIGASLSLAATARRGLPRSNETTKTRGPRVRRVANGAHRSRSNRGNSTT